MLQRFTENFDTQHLENKKYTSELIIKHPRAKVNEEGKAVEKIEENSDNEEHYIKAYAYNSNQSENDLVSTENVPTSASFNSIMSDSYQSINKKGLHETSKYYNRGNIEKEKGTQNVIDLKVEHSDIKDRLVTTGNIKSPFSSSYNSRMAGYGQSVDKSDTKKIAIEDDDTDLDKMGTQNMINIKIDYSDIPTKDQVINKREDRIRKKKEGRNGAYKTYRKYQRSSSSKGNKFEEHDYENLKFSLGRGSKKIVKFNLNT